MTRRPVSHTTMALSLLVLLVAPLAVHAQQTQSGSTTQATQDDPSTLRIRLPVLTVTAEKEPEDAQQTPVSVTVVPKDTLEQAGVRSVSDAAEYAPNTFFHEFTARKLSNPRFRGVGSSPNNPGVATYIDGVPQLNANSSSIELTDVEQIEFVRGPQSSLFGRNSLGGLISITSSRPSLNEWTGTVTGPFGNFMSREARAAASGPLVAGKLAIGVAFGYSARDGFTTNDVTGHDLDFRSALSTKGQLLWTPAPEWEARVIVTGERARDGDYGLNDLAALRSRPFHAMRDFEGFTRRDIVAPTVLIRRAGKAVEVSATTGLVWWETSDLTDLDYSPMPLVTRSNAERDLQVTQEFRVASAKDVDVPLSGNVSLKWQTGLFVFKQDYEQDAVNMYSPFLLSPFINFSVSQHTPQSTLEDRGVGVYGRGTFTIRRRLEATVGLRGDYEKKRATLDTFFSPMIAPPTAVAAEDAFSDVSPHVIVAYHVVPASRMLYASASRGFKAGGFNAASPSGSEAYSVEHSWNYEAGAKSSWLGGRVSVNAAVFYLEWDDLQVNLPNPLVPGQFFIANTAGAASKGAELEVNARLLAGCDFFGGIGYTNARFADGSVSDGLDVSGNQLSNTPTYTANFGGQYSAALTSRANLYARAEVVFRGDYQYDDANTEGQEAYSIANFRAGVRGSRLFAEAWIRNAFDTRYVPVAFAYPGLAPSGFVGESGAPRVFGLRAGFTF